MLFLSYVVWLRSKRLGMNNHVSRFFFSILTTYDILINIYIWIFFYFIQMLYPSKHPQQTASNTVSLNCISTYERHRTSYKKTNCTHDKINCTVFLIDYWVHLTVRILEPRPSNFPLKKHIFYFIQVTLVNEGALLLKNTQSCFLYQKQLLYILRCVPS